MWTGMIAPLILGKQVDVLVAVLYFQHYEMANPPLYRRLNVYHRLASAKSSEAELLRRIAWSEIVSTSYRARETLVPDGEGVLGDVGAVNVGYASRAVVPNDLVLTVRLVVVVEVHQSIDIPFPVHSQANFPCQAQLGTHYFFADHPARTAKRNLLAVFVPRVLVEGTAVFQFPRVSLLQYTNY
jgi:hypothetical protein